MATCSVCFPSAGGFVCFYGQFSLFWTLSFCYFLHNVFVFVAREVWVSKEGKRRGGWAVHVCKRVLWFLQREREGERQRERERRRERDTQHLPKKTVFLVWMPAEFRNHAITIWKESSHDLLLSLFFFLSFTRLLALSDPAHFYLIEHWRLPTYLSFLSEMSRETVSEQPNCTRIKISDWNVLLFLKKRMLLNMCFKRSLFFQQHQRLPVFLKLCASAKSSTSSKFRHNIHLSKHCCLWCRVQKMKL